jgi:predicted nucleic acid-binding protein
VIEDIYLDTCALSRLTDDVSQSRINAESTAVDLVLDLVATHSVRWFASEALRLEILGNPNPDKRAETLPLLALSSGLLAVTPPITHRANVLQAEGFGAFDALHFALCEGAGIPWLLTVDDRFIRQASRTQPRSNVHLLNPIDWLQRRSAWSAKQLSPK